MRSQVYPEPLRVVHRLESLNMDWISRGGTRIVKRAFDFCVALVGLIILSPVFAYVAILIRTDSPGPVFFWGWRMGRNGHPFRMLKFRTMYERPESYEGPPVTAANDARITPLGQWLRDTKLNELPQLWNVLKGDMSLVGPRPEDVEIAQGWPKEAFDEILSIRPGITSPTSVLYHDEERMLSQDNLMRDYLKRILPDKIRLDRLYVRHHSFFSDLDAIFWTMAVILPQLAKTSIPEGYLFAGPISRFVHRYVSWFVLDSLVALGVAHLASLVWNLDEGSLSRVGPMELMALILALLFSGINSLSGLNRVFWSEATIDDAFRLVISSAFMTGMIFAINYLETVYRWFGFPPMRASMILFIGMGAGFGFLLIRFRLRVLSSVARRWVNWRRQESHVGEHVLVVGMGEANRIANYLLRQKSFRTAFSVIGTVDDSNPSQHGMRVNGNWMLGGIKDIPALVKKHDVGMIISTLAPHNTENEHILEVCQGANVRLLFLEDLMSMTDRQVTLPVGQLDQPLWQEGRSEFKAMHDAITGLPNRYLYRDRLQQSLARARRRNMLPAVMFIQLDGIRSIKDAHGDQESDQALKEVAERLAGSIRDGETLARLGFDRFALILDDLPVEQDIYTIIERLSARGTLAFDIDGRRYQVIPKIDFCLSHGACEVFDAPETAMSSRCSGCVLTSDSVDRGEPA